MTFNLEQFEVACYRRDHESACRQLMALLNHLDANYGQFGGIEARLRSADIVDHEAHINARITSAISTLLSDFNVYLTPEGFAQFIAWQRWIGSLFGASDFGNTDHILDALNSNAGGEGFEIDFASFTKFCLLYTADSEVPLSLETLCKHDAAVTIALCFALLSPRFLGTSAAHAKRELLLGWLPEVLATRESPAGIPLSIIHDVYMHCSYAQRPDKHRIKVVINDVIRRLAQDWGLGDLALGEPRGCKNGKPVLLVVLEWFSAAHSVFRTHSASMRGLRSSFHVVGMGQVPQVDDAGRAVFDEFIELAGPLTEALAQVRETAERLAPAVIYYPAVGMFPTTIFLSNLRLAPIQVTALGHGASTMSRFIDYFIVDEDFVGDPARFSETLLLMPPEGMPQVPSASYEPIEPVVRNEPVTVRIAVAATPMKLNPAFLETLAAVAARVLRPIRFEFLCGLSAGLMARQIERFIHKYLPQAEVRRHLDYMSYMSVLNSCDLFLNPFPYGNMNGIVDMMHLGLPGVCLAGPDVHEHIDVGMFERAGLPDWLIARSVEDYVAAAVRLVDDHAERTRLRLELLDSGAVERFFAGDAQMLGRRLLALVENLDPAFASEPETAGGVSGGTCKSARPGPAVPAERATGFGKPPRHQARKAHS